jgi:predicted transcriptional regulator
MSTNHVSVRLDDETIARVDALAPQFSTQWRAATRSDVLRGLILTALAAREAADRPGEAASLAGAGPAGRGGGKGRGRKSERDPR